MWSWLRRLAYAMTEARHDAELREEIDAHRALRAAHLERQGLTPQQAAEASRRAIGNVLLAREEAREVWLGSWATWQQDVRYGLRTFRRSPTFTAVAIATLALGIGVNAGIFTVLNGVLFRDLPAAAAHELLSIEQAVAGGAPASTAGSGTFTTAEYVRYRDSANALSGVLAHSDARETTLGGGTPQEVFGTFVSCNYFTVLQDLPPLGRGLAPRDCERGADPVVVLGHRLWSTAFGADAGIIGRTIELDRRRLTVVGVAGERTYGGALMKTDFFAPLIAEPLLGPDSSRYDNPSYRWLHLIGRRGGGIATAQVRTELDVIAAQIDRQHPGRTTVLTVSRATPMNIPAPVRGAAAGAAAVLMAAFGLVLLIACANVANMLLARGSVRSQEIGIRLALGASRGRVVRQLMTESLLMAIAGGLLGSVLALWSFHALMATALPAVLHPEIPAFAWAVDVRPDVRVLWFALALTLGTGLLFGAAPALHLSRPDLHAAARQDAAGTGRRGARLRGTLVGVQVALSMVLMIATGLLLRGLHAAYTTSPGFDYEDVAYLSFGTDYGPPDLLDQRLMDRVAALPGVDATAYASQTPLGESSMGAVVSLPGQGERRVEFDDVTPGYFALLGLRMVRWRPRPP